MSVTWLARPNYSFKLHLKGFCVIFVKVSQILTKSHLKFSLLSQISVHSLWHVCNFYESWYVAWGTPSYNNLFKRWPWVDLDPFWGKVKFCDWGFSIGKVKALDCSETIATCDLKVGRCRQLIELMKWVFKVKIFFFDLGSRSFTYENWGLLFSETTRLFFTIFGKLLGTWK